VYKTRHEYTNLAGGQSFHFSVQFPSAEVGKEGMLPLFVAMFRKFPTAAVRIRSRNRRT